MNRMELQNYCDHNPYCNHQCSMCPAYQDWSKGEGQDDEDEDCEE